MPPVKVHSFTQPVHLAAHHGATKIFVHHHRCSRALPAGGVGSAIRSEPAHQSEQRPLETVLHTERGSAGLSSASRLVPILFVAEPTSPGGRLDEGAATRDVAGSTEGTRRALPGSTGPVTEQDAPLHRAVVRKGSFGMPRLGVPSRDSDDSA
ncbi:MAG: hypothetical protein K0Q46_5688 [Rhodococcus erythropolis]|nr:hypothetical protein [Rhodococcus erythropolis]